MNIEIWVKQVREHAKANYDRDGWDILVECWEDKDIVQAGCPCNTYEQFVFNVWSTLRVMDSRRKDIQGEVF